MAQASSPISQLLKTLGLSKEDLLKHSSQMREFLDAHAPCTDPAAPSLSEPKSEPAPTSAASSPPSTPGRKKFDDRKLLSSGGTGTMEAVLERKSRQHKRDHKRRDRQRVLHSPSPSMRYTGLPSLSSGRPRDLRLHASMDDTRTTPATNRHYRTYSEARMNVSSPLLQFPSSSRSIYETPRKKGSSSSLLPPSSPPVSSSPVVTPATSSRYHKLVSSPGPLQPLPDESEYENLPFKLPPGPYRDTKPELSYAALIGQAILASPEHRLTLQEIYDFITIVYPYYKRDETTWMNSIRHVLSTTTAFRKQLRERSQGRTLWAIWDCDLDAFKDGGFKKSKCAKPSEARPDAPPPSKVLAVAAASSSKKRGAPSVLPDGGDTIKKPKRRRRASSPAGDGDDDDESATEKHQVMFSSIPTMHTVPIFAPTGHFVTQHQQQQQHQHYQKQPYAESWKSVPTMVMFPPIPASLRPAATTTASSVVASSSAPASSSSPNLDMEELANTPRWEPEEEEGVREKKENKTEKAQADGGKKATLVAADSFSSISSHTRSSSPLPSELESDDLPLEALLAIESEDEEEASELRALQYPSSTSEDEAETNHSQANIAEKRSPSPPPSPSPAHRIAATQTKLHNSTTPPPPPALALLPPMPKTPPPRKEGLSGADGSLSASLRTPSTRRFSFGAPGSGSHGGFAALSTPLFAPVTPKKGDSCSHGIGSAGGSTNSGGGGGGGGAVGGSGSAGGGGALPGVFDGESPFRTPTSGLRGSLFDPHNPSTLLEEELARYQSGGGMVDSPAGLYGKYKASPGSFGSPTRWW